MARTVIENVFEIDRPPAVVFDYASDHTHEPEWNPKMRWVRKLTEGPIGKGTRYEMEFVPGRPLMVACVGFDRPDRWEAVGDTLGMTSEQMRFASGPGPTPGWSIDPTGAYLYTL